jgi:hypothetical protein
MRSRRTPNAIALVPLPQKQVRGVITNFRNGL